MKQSTKQLTVSALLFALGLVLPFLTGQVPQIGNMLLPMHFPVFLCAFLCGWQYALFLGFLLPICRSMIFGMPHMFPVAIAMAFELAAYGLIAGLVYGRSKQKSTASLYVALISAMILGRVVWGIVEVLLLGIGENAFTWQMFLSGALLEAIPGIILQLILIPGILVALRRSGHFLFEHTKRP